MNNEHDGFWQGVFLGAASAVCLTIVCFSIAKKDCGHEGEIRHLIHELSECNAAVKKAEHLMNDSNIIIVGNE